MIKAIIASLAASLPILWEKHSWVLFLALFLITLGGISFPELKAKYGLKGALALTALFVPVAVIATWFSVYDYGKKFIDAGGDKTATTTELPPSTHPETAAPKVSPAPPAVELEPERAPAPVPSSDESQKGGSGIKPAKKQPPEKKDCRSPTIRFRLDGDDHTCSGYAANEAAQSIQRALVSHGFQIDPKDGNVELYIACNTSRKEGYLGPMVASIVLKGTCLENQSQMSQFDLEVEGVSDAQNPSDPDDRPAKTLALSRALSKLQSVLPNDR